MVIKSFMCKLMAVACVLGMSFSTAIGAEPTRDAERELDRFDQYKREIERKLDLKDKSQIKEVMKQLDKAEDQVRPLMRAVEKIEKDTKNSKIKDKRRKVVDQIKKLEDRVEKAIDKLKRAGDDPSKAKDAKSPIKDAIREIKEVESKLKDLASIIKEEAKKAGEGNKKLAEKVKSLASTIDKLQSAKNGGSSVVSDASKKADEIKKEAEKVSGSDSSAKAIKKDWPKAAKTVKDTLKVLGEMKALENAAEPGVSSCKNDDKALDTLIKAYTSKSDEKNKKKLLDGVKKFKKAAQAAEKAGKTAQGKMKTAKGKVKTPSLKSPWDKVKSALVNVREGASDRLDRDVKTLGQTCGPLAQGEQNPKVKKALKGGDKKNAERNKELIGRVKALATSVGQVASVKGTATAKVKAAQKKAADISKQASNAQGDDSETKTIRTQWPAWSA